MPSDGEQPKDMLGARKVAGPKQRWASCCWGQQAVVAPQKLPRRGTASRLVALLKSHRDESTGGRTEQQESQRLKTHLQRAQKAIAWCYTG